MAAHAEAKKEAEAARREAGELYRHLRDYHDCADVNLLKSAFQVAATPARPASGAEADPPVDWRALLVEGATQTRSGDPDSTRQWDFRRWREKVLDALAAAPTSGAENV
jgi:hypothetical protein